MAIQNERRRGLEVPIAESTAQAVRTGSCAIILRSVADAPISIDPRAPADDDRCEGGVQSSLHSIPPQVFLSRRLAPGIAPVSGGYYNTKGPHENRRSKHLKFATTSVYFSDKTLKYAFQIQFFGYEENYCCPKVGSTLPAK
jgi:hypothetical protein